jgi:phosphoribosyl-AMP cyclohydrolase
MVERPEGCKFTVGAVSQWLPLVGGLASGSLQATREKGLVTFWSRARQTLWTKGETSGNQVRLVGIYYNCEDNVLLVKARLDGGVVCHTDHRTCFFRELDG